MSDVYAELGKVLTCIDHAAEHLRLIEKNTSDWRDIEDVQELRQRARDLYDDVIRLQPRISPRNGW